MDNPTTITVIGSIIAALVLAGFSFYAGNIQKKQSDADKADLLNANKVLSDSVNQKNEELVQKSDGHARNLETYAQKLEQFANEQKAKDKQLIDLQKQLATEAITQKKETEKLANLSLKLNETQAKLIETQAKATELALENLNFTTGGNSYCYAIFYGESDHDVKIRLYHHGKYPLTILKVVVTRVSGIERKAEGNAPRIKGLIINKKYASTFDNVPVIQNTKDAYELGAVPFDPQFNESYSIEFKAKNGDWSQSWQYIKNQQGYSMQKSKVRVNGVETIIRE